MNTQLRYSVKQNGEIMACTKYWYEANLVYESLYKRGKEYESVYPFVVELIDPMLKKGSKRYQTEVVSQQMVDDMIREYGI